MMHQKKTAKKLTLTNFAILLSHMMNKKNFQNTAISCIVIIACSFVLFETVKFRLNQELDLHGELRLKCQTQPKTDCPNMLRMSSSSMGQVCSYFTFSIHIH